MTEINNPLPYGRGSLNSHFAHTGVRSLTVAARIRDMAQSKIINPKSTIRSLPLAARKHVNCIFGLRH